MQEENKISISERIYQLRKESGKSQGELADLLKVSRQSVSKWENGTSNPEIENLVELSKIFGVSVDDIVNYNPNKQAEISQTIYQYQTTAQESKSKKTGIITLLSGLVLTLVGLFLSRVLLIIGVVCVITGLFMATFKKGKHLYNTWVAFATLYLIVCNFSTGPLYSFMTLLFAVGLADMMQSMPAQTIISLSTSAIFTVLSAITILKGKDFQSKISGFLFAIFFYSVSIVLSSISSFFHGFFMFAWSNIIFYGGYIAYYIYIACKKQMNERGIFTILCSGGVLSLYSFVSSIIATLANFTLNAFVIYHITKEIAFVILFAVLITKYWKTLPLSANK